MESYSANFKKLKACISGIDKLAKDAEQQLKSIAIVNYVQLTTELELVDCLKQCDIFWFRLNHKLTRSILKGVKCKYILCAVTGLDHIDIKSCEEFGIKVISLKNEFEFLREIRATAEHTFGLMLALIRKSKSAFKHVESGLWNRYLFEGTELYEKKIGILGFGRLGEIVANYAFAFGMEVYYYDIIHKTTNSSFMKCESAEELFSIVDVLSIHLPYNEQTHFMVNKRLLNYMKPGCFLINTSRGGLVNEDELALMIKKRKIGGYATDVLYGEPTIENHPLVHLSKTHENVLITPHIGGNTYESIERTENFVAQKLLNIILN
ncbi:hypothetical protein EC396_10910 [Lutibacter sp. HS1-25]|uniref:NAD(P)-dependent oxidoreductase n=1 Tax=Lutibacter sp. HS1-25 TaxID=2485000 RepID=UPI0010129717|nr:D-isomer specific 2-hydroxyacid dehydrogenase family protein [Lutibacter sp. HS1-25]RXP52737.1 hypothetical protein EC396_10910 [Lutibacter sp. HS1-25]